MKEEKRGNLKKELKKIWKENKNQGINTKDIIM